jgi:hypothetical protein
MRVELALVGRQHNAWGGGAVPPSNPKRTLRLRKSKLRNRGNDLLRAQ